MLWMIPLALAAAGALADKKNPVRGAALGAGIGMTGGLLAPAAGAGAAAAGAGAAAAGTATAAGTGLGAGAATGLAGMGDAGLMYGGANAAAASSLGGGASVMGGSALPTAGGGLLGTMNQYGKPAMEAMSKSGLLGGEQQQPAPQAQPVQQATGGPQTLAQIAQQGDQIQQQLQQTQMQRKQRRMGLLGREVA